MPTISAPCAARPPAPSGGGCPPLAVAAVAFAIFAIAWPLSAARYPPMVDLPFHAAQTAALRHYFDPAFHFREQFELRPFAVPYLSMYALGGLLA